MVRHHTISFPLFDCDLVKDFVRLPVDVIFRAEEA